MTAPNPASFSFTTGGGATVGSEHPGVVRASMSDPALGVFQLNITPDDARRLAETLSVAAALAEREEQP